MAPEAREQQIQSKPWLTIENFIQALVAGCIFAFTAYQLTERYYKLKIEAVQAKVDIDISKKEAEWRAAQDEQRAQLESYREYAQKVSNSRDSMLTWLKAFQERLSLQTKHLNSAVQDSEAVRWFEQYVTAEIHQMEEIGRLLRSSSGDSHTMSAAAKEALDALDKFTVSVQVIYDKGYEGLAKQITKTLRDERYRVIDPIHWFDFREDGDGHMSRFFQDAPALWYQSKDAATSRGAAQLARTLSRVLPENMVIHHGHEVKVIGTTWQIGPQMLQVWLFQKPVATKKG